MTFDLGDMAVHPYDYSPEEWSTALKQARADLRAAGEREERLREALTTIRDMVYRSYGLFRIDEVAAAALSSEPPATDEATPSQLGRTPSDASKGPETLNHEATPVVKED